MPQDSNTTALRSEKPERCGIADNEERLLSLINRAQSNRHALDYLVAKYVHPTALAIGAKHFGNPDLGFEIAQNTAVNVLANFHRVRGFETVPSFYAYIRTIAFRECINIHRFCKRAPAILAEIEEEICESLDEPISIAETNERISELHNALSALSQRERKLIQLRFFQHLRLKDIAERLDLPVGSVGSTLHRLYGKLRIRLRKCA